MHLSTVKQLPALNVSVWCADFRTGRWRAELAAAPQRQASTNERSPAQQTRPTRYGLLSPREQLFYSFPHLTPWCFTLVPLPGGGVGDAGLKWRNRTLDWELPECRAKRLGASSTRCHPLQPSPRSWRPSGSATVSSSPPPACGFCPTSASPHGCWQAFGFRKAPASSSLNQCSTSSCPSVAFPCGSASRRPGALNGTAGTLHCAPKSVKLQFEGKPITFVCVCVCVCVCAYVGVW